MPPDNSQRRASGVAESDADEGGSTHVVLVVDGDPAVTAATARALRRGYAVRTAQSSEDAFASLDDEVRVALVDPSVFDCDGPALVARLTDASECRVAALGDAHDDAFHARVTKPVAEDALRSTVDRLCHCAVYRSTLDEFYDVAAARATLAPDDPQHDRLDRRVDDLKRRLDEVATTLDSEDIYETAVGDRAPDAAVHAGFEP